MKSSFFGWAAAVAFYTGHALAANNTIAAHVAAAQAAAGTSHIELFKLLCAVPDPSPAAAAQTTPAPGPSTSNAWHAEPVKVFDNLYFVGQKDVSVWAVTTSAGIIVLDTIYDYSVEDEVAGGLKKLGFDPATIKYAIVSHGHSDHMGGAKFLQDHYGTHVLMSAADWDLVDRTARPAWKPKRDMVVTDGQKLTLGDTTLTMYLTPGHTMGTISTLIPVKDNGQSHLAAEWGGTAFNFGPRAENFDAYIQSAARFRDVVTAANADILLSNHTVYDGSIANLPAMATRKAGNPNPYVIGNDSIRRFLTTAEECAKAGRMKLQP